MQRGQGSRPSFLGNRERPDGAAQEHRTRQGAVGGVGASDPTPPHRDRSAGPVLTAVLLEGVPAGACYRYRTAALVGPWRECWNEAQDDAVRARQAYIDDQKGAVWALDGCSIEIGCPQEEAGPTG